MQKKKQYYPNIEKDLKAYIETFGCTYMPTCKEMNDNGYAGLRSRVSENGGIYYWARRFKLPLKESNATFGMNNEYRAKWMLEGMGYTVKKMPTGHPFDLLVDDCLRVDVKTANATFSKGVRKHDFRLKKEKECDFYICLVLDENGEIEKFLVLPVGAAKEEQVKIRMGKSSIYDKYIDRFDLLDKFLESVTA